MILYINNSDEFCKKPTDYITSELIYGLCFDCMEENELKDLEYPPTIDENIKSKNKIVHWIQYLEKNFMPNDEKPLTTFLKIIKKFFNANGIKLILVWDQINILYSMETSNQNQNIFNALCTKILFDSIYYSASNNNNQIISFALMISIWK